MERGYLLLKLYRSYSGLQTKHLDCSENAWAYTMQASVHHNWSLCIIDLHLCIIRNTDRVMASEVHDVFLQWLDAELGAGSLSKGFRSEQRLSTITWGSNRCWVIEQRLQKQVMSFYNQLLKNWVLGHWSRIGSYHSFNPFTAPACKFLGWKVHTYTPANSIFDGPIRNLLSILRILTEIL